MPPTFIVRDYYIDNYVVYGLDPPPPAFEWIRFGPDLLLVDLQTGDISQVVYGAFAESDDSGEG